MIGGGFMNDMNKTIERNKANAQKEVAEGKVRSVWQQ